MEELSLEQRTERGINKNELRILPDHGCETKFFV